MLATLRGLWSVVLLRGAEVRLLHRGAHEKSDRPELAPSRRVSGGMRLNRSFFYGIVAVVVFCEEGRADTPPLLAQAVARWSAGSEDLAFTQQTQVFSDDGKVKEQRIERYDPSLPDTRRWRLIESNGHPATAAQRRKWETWKNSKARKQVSKSLAEYLYLEKATLVSETPTRAHFEVGLRPEVARLIAVEKISVVVSVDKESGTIAHIAATLREPIRVLLGLARITDLDLDVGIEPSEGGAAVKSGEVQTGSTARVMMSKFGDPTEYRWSEFKRVPTYSQRKDQNFAEATKP